MAEVFLTPGCNVMGAGRKGGVAMSMLEAFYCGAVGREFRGPWRALPDEGGRCGYAQGMQLDTGRWRQVDKVVVRWRGRNVTRNRLKAYACGTRRGFADRGRPKGQRVATLPLGSCLCHTT